jgi:hypothetical protein
MVFPAQTVIAESLEDAAFGYGVAALATSGNPLKFGFQFLQMGNAQPYFMQLGYGYLIRLFAGTVRVLAEFDQIADCGHRQTEIPAMLDEAKSIKLRRLVATLIALGSKRRFQKAFLFIISDGRNLDAGSL